MSSFEVFSLLILLPGFDHSFKWHLLCTYYIAGTSLRIRGVGEELSLMLTPGKITNK
jgi:hypothetical protein